MALIVSYTTLQSAMDDLLDNTLFTSKYPEMIQLFEAAANRRLRVRQQETSTNLTPSSGSATLPTDYLSWRRVTWTGDTRRELEYVHPSYLQATSPSSAAGTPVNFTIEGSTLKVRPVDDTALEFLYFQKLPPLASNTDNWLLLAHPDLYLFGALVEAEMYGLHDERAALWKLRRDEIFDDIERLSNKSRGAGTVRVMGATP